jgi:hypothetical protein
MMMCDPETYFEMLEEMYGLKEPKEEEVEEKKKKEVRETVDPEDTSYQYGFPQ